MSVVKNPATNGSRALSPATTNKEVEYVPLGASDTIKLSVNIIRLILNPMTKNGRPAPDDQILKFMMLCRARKLDPFEGDAYLLGYEGNDGGDSWTLITSIYAFLKRAEISPHYDGIQSGIIVRTKAGAIEEHEGDMLMEDEFLLGGWATVYRKDRKYPKKTRVEFIKYSTGKSRWKADPCGMISKVAECQALRDTFPTTLGGLFSKEEMDTTGVVRLEATNTKGQTIEDRIMQDDPPIKGAMKPTGEGVITRPIPDLVHEIKGHLKGIPETAQRVEALKKFWGVNGETQLEKQPVEVLEEGLLRYDEHLKDQAGE